jgi:hypothetical protein
MKNKQSTKTRKQQPLFAAFLFGLHVDLEDGGSIFLQNISEPDYTGLYPRNKQEAGCSCHLPLAWLNLQP